MYQACYVTSSHTFFEHMGFLWLEDTDGGTPSIQQLNGRGGREDAVMPLFRNRWVVTVGEKERIGEIYLLRLFLGMDVRRGYVSIEMRPVCTIWVLSGSIRGTEQRSDDGIGSQLQG